uniref:C2H2-type domain-containing protein n=1 Tax=Clastoptera arizonana TaxID=38151 RepID=A0A1B6CQR6_9HEMI
MVTDADALLMEKLAKRDIRFRVLSKPANTCKHHMYNVNIKNPNKCHKSALQRHLNIDHSSESKKYLNCPKCTFNTVHKSDLKTSTKPFKCSLCNARYKESKCLRYHERKIHQIGDKPVSKLKRKCPICKIIFTGGSSDKEDIHKHFEIDHNINLQREILQFSSIDNFFKWKREIEKKTTTFFIKQYALPTAMAFRCHRSGNYKKTGSDKRSLKMIGSCKIDAFCPAMMKIKILENQSVKVFYISKHIGHENELKHIQLTKEERNQIAIQLASKISYDEILKGIQNTASNNDLKRIHLLNKKDLVNIKNSFNYNNFINNCVNQSNIKECDKNKDFDILEPLVFIDENQDEKQNCIETTALHQINCEKKPNSSFDEEKNKMIEEIKIIVNSLVTKDEINFVRTLLREFIPTLRCTKCDSEMCKFL